MYIITKKNKHTAVTEAPKKVLNPEPGFQSGPGDSVDAD